MTGEPAATDSDARSHKDVRSHKRETVAPGRSRAKDRIVADLTARAQTIDEVLSAAGDRLDPGDRAVVERDVELVADRLALGVDRTVVGLVGGTGSGKSTLFNALTGLLFAEPGVRRPMTTTVTAVVWGDPVPALLDWLRIKPDHRHQRESLLDADDEVALRGLVLLDLPDHDSIAVEHRAEVERLLPMTDVLVWVLDPQKYADNAVHSRYLATANGREGTMIVVLNQIDTVPEESLDRLIADVAKVLADDGLEGVSVLPISARTGAGLPQLRAALAKAVAKRSKAEQNADAALAAAADHLASSFGKGEPARADLPEAATIERVLDAVGMGALADHAVQRLRTGDGVSRPTAADMPGLTTAVAAARDQLISAATQTLPAAWVRDMQRRTVPAEDCARHIVDSLSAVEFPRRRPRAWGVLAALMWLAAAVAIGFAAVAVGAALAGANRLPIIAMIVAIVGALGLLVFALVRRSKVRGDCVRTRERILADVRSRVTAVIDNDLFQPCFTVLGEHRQLRALLDRIRGRAAAGDRLAS